MSKAPIEKRLAHLCSRYAVLSEWVSRFARYYMDLGTNFNGNYILDSLTRGNAAF